MRDFRALDPATPIAGKRDLLLAEDGNLRMRLLCACDLPKMTKWLSDERVLEFYEGRDTHWTQTDVAAHFFGPPDHDVEFLRVAIELDNEAVGYGQLYRLYGPLFDLYRMPDTGESVYAMDQFIGEPDLWGAGIGTRYVRLATDWLVRERGATAVVMDPRKANARAVRCYQKAGFEIVGDLPAHELHEGQRQDCWLMRYAVK